VAKNGIIKRRRIATAWDGDRYLNSAHRPEVPAPSALSAIADGTVVSLSWIDESSGSAGAVIQRSPNGSTGWVQIGAYAAGVLAAEDVVSAGTYYYRALGIFRGLTSETPSSTADVTVVAPVPAPASFLVTVDSYDITLSWVDESGGTAQHVIQNSADGSTGWSTIATKSTGVTSHSITGLSDGTYYYRIYATLGGNSSGYVYASATIDTPLSAPSNFTAQASGTTVSFSWTDNNGATAQTRIEVSTTSGSTGFSTLTTVAAGTTTYQATSVAADDYWYRALAVDGVDTSPNTAAVAVTVSTGSGGGVGISSITGTPSDGATITVNGGSFGTMGGDVLGFIRGDEAADGATANGVSASIGTIATYLIGVGADTTGDHLRFSASAARGTKTRGIRRVHTGGVTGTYHAGGFGFSGFNTTKYYITYYRRLNMTWASPNGYNYKHYYTFGNNNNNPQSMLFVPQTGSAQGFYNNNPVSSDSYSVKNMMNTAGWSATDESNAWHRWEVYADLGNTPTTRNGVLRVWRNRTLGITSDAWVGRGPNLADTTYTRQWFLGYMDQSMDSAIIDHTDAYIATTMARVELGNSSTWSACTQTEIQPVTNANWSDTQLNNVRVNHGSFSSGQTAYLYVIKSDGQPVSNSGYSVVLP